MSSRRLSVLIGAAIALAPPCAIAQAPTAADRTVTFTKDIAPILQDKCQSCHRPDNMAPMSLITYQDVRPWVRSIKARVANREMPPWHIDKTVGIQKFVNDSSLSDAQIALIVKWVDAGAPQGDPKDMPPAKAWPTGDRFALEALYGPPDLVVQSKPWTMPAQGPDVLFENEVEIPQLTEARWVRASETKPSLRGRRVAHHASTYITPAQTAEAMAVEQQMRNGQPGSAEAVAARSRGERELFTEWAQGKGGEIFPDNVGKLVTPGTKASFEIHYHAVGEEITDQLETAWWFLPKGETPKYTAEFVPLGCVHCTPDALQIPPNSVVEHQGTLVLQAPAMLHNFQPHMHYRGKAQSLEAIYPDGRRELINRITRYTNTWHVNYIYDPDYAPIFPKGTVLIVSSIHDNTAANKNNPDPRQWVSGGNRTVDEMAHLNEQVIYLTEEDYQRLSEQRKKRAAGQN